LRRFYLSGDPGAGHRLDDSIRQVFIGIVGLLPDA
jgi:hypothetical protein